MTGSTRWVVAFAFVGLFIACSKVGPDDGMGGSGGSTGALGRGGAWGGIAGTGGFPRAEDLSCLRNLFADCPTIPGTCSGRNLGAGGATPSAYKFCYAAGTTALVTPLISCPGNSAGWSRDGEVYKPDGTLCYTFSRVNDCASPSETTTITFRDPAGAIVGTARSGFSTTFYCANYETCPGLPGYGGNGYGAGSNCLPYLPGFQCVDDGNCP